MKRIMVTGGAGYIGSHAVLALAEQGYEILTYDNLSTGHRDAVFKGEFVEGDLADKELLGATIQKFRPDAVMSFAASIQVAESVEKPFMYYRNNVVNTLTLLEAMQENGVRRFIFSSTAAVYGEPEKTPITERAPIVPINPYGGSKAMVEAALRQLSHIGAIDYVALRYFNVAGAHPDGLIGQRYKAATHLITRAVKTARGEFGKLQVFGTDYPTPDGTCVRDYIHVVDLAEAHLKALDYLGATGQSGVFNLGYGRGFSVREVIEGVKRVTGVDFPVEETGRRDGDPAILVADSDRAKETLEWRPRFDDLEMIIRHAWEWELKLAGEK